MLRAGLRAFSHRVPPTLVLALPRRGLAVLAPGAGGHGTLGTPSAKTSASSSSSLSTSSGPSTSSSSGTSGAGTSSGSSGSSGAQGAQMSASSKHPFELAGAGAMPRGGMRDPAAGPNSRPEMEGTPAANSSAANPTKPTSPTSPSTGTSSSSTPPHTATSSSVAEREARGPRATDEVRDPVRGPSSKALSAETPETLAAVTEQTIPDLRRTHHPFDTYSFVSRLERAGVSAGAAHGLMEGVRALLVSRGGEARRTMLSIEEMDKAAYRFKAALSELRTEQSVRTRNDGVALRSAASAMRREVDALDQQMKVDLQTLRHDVDLDLNNRKTETRYDMKRFDIGTEELNNKFTIFLGDLRTDIESAKWDATRRAISIIALLVTTGIALSTFYLPAAKPPPPPPKPAPAMVTRDIGVGPDDNDHMDEHQHHVEQHLDTLLQDRMWRERKPPRQSQSSIHSERI